MQIQLKIMNSTNIILCLNVEVGWNVDCFKFSFFRILLDNIKKKKLIIDNIEKVNKKICSK
jgi:hypothetical protein